jgi:glutamate synthase domain-containing protein 3
MTTNTNTSAGAALPAIAWADGTATIDAGGVFYRQLNQQVRAALDKGARRIVLNNVCGQRYIGDGLRKPGVIEVNGTPGNDLAMFMDGPTVIVHANAQDGAGNTMTSGQVVVHGCAGDVLAHSLRGGSIFVRDSAGYRVAIHMKQYHEPVPAVVIGGCVGDYAGEYMAGGVLAILGLPAAMRERAGSLPTATRERAGSLNTPSPQSPPDPAPPITGHYLGTGMHGGVIYLRGDIRDEQMGREISRVPMDDADRTRLAALVGSYAAHFNLNAQDILAAEFTKLAATSSRPYGRLYVY